jgi:hypothetical protein
MKQQGQQYVYTGYHAYGKGRYGNIKKKSKETSMCVIG